MRAARVRGQNFGESHSSLPAQVGATGKTYVYNHVQLIVKYHETDAGARIVGLYAEPYSVRHKFAAGVDSRAKIKVTCARVCCSQISVQNG